MKAVVHQAFGNIGLGNSGGGFEYPEVKNDFVRHASMLPCVENGEKGFQAAFHIIGIENRRARCPGHSRGAEHPDVSMGDQENQRASPRRGGHRRKRPGRAGFDDRVAGQTGRKGLGDRNRPHARATTAMRYAEGLVQVQVAYIGTDPRRTG